MFLSLKILGPCPMFSVSIEIIMWFLSSVLNVTMLSIWHIRVLKGNRINGISYLSIQSYLCISIYTYIFRLIHYLSIYLSSISIIIYLSTNIYFKELAHMILEASKFKTCRASQQARDQEKNFSSSLRVVCWQEFLFLW